MTSRALLVALALAGCVAPGSEVGTEAAALGGGLTQVTGFGANASGLRMWKYVPPSMPANAPLVVALHACTQTASTFANSGWNAIADKYKFYVLYPEQNSTNNALTCFNWAGSNTNLTTGENDPANLTRAMGENESIKEMVDKMKADHGIDPKRIFVTGLSAGGAQAALLLAVWPDVFAGGATFAGIPYYCTTNKNKVSTCLNPGIPRTAKEWGDLVRAGDPGFAGPWPRLAIWQGVNDSLVSVANQTEIMKQWTDVHGIAQTPAASDMVGTIARDIYRNAKGEAVVQVYKVPSMDHGVPVDPKNGCGTAGQYFLDKGICAAQLVADDWGLNGSASALDLGVALDMGGAGGGGGGGDGDDGGAGGGAGGGGTGGGGSGGGGGKPGKPLPPGCSTAGDLGGALANFAPVLLVLLALVLRRRRAVRRLAGTLVALAALVALPTKAHAGGQFVSDSFGGRSYKLYVPSGYTNQPLPLVLMLHGCTQDPDQFAAGSQMNVVAEANNFFVLYPDEPTATQQLKCWQWWDPAHQQRGSGEPAALVALVDHVAAQYSVDGARVFAAGLSAGAAMSVILGATYPDRFGAIVVAAGLEYGAASSAQTAGSVGFAGGPDPAQQGRAAVSAMGAVGRPVRVLVFHGSSDSIVAPINGDQVVAQWRATDAALGVSLGAAADSSEPMTVAGGGRTYTRAKWGDWIEKVTVDGMGHAWPGGPASASYTDPKGPDASAMSWSFFAATPDNPGGGAGGGGGTTPMAHSGCSAAPGSAPSSAAAIFLALGLLAARKRATPSGWTRSSGSSSSSRKRA